MDLYQWSSFFEVIAFITLANIFNYHFNIFLQNCTNKTDQHPQFLFFYCDLEIIIDFKLHNSVINNKYKKYKNK